MIRRSAFVLLSALAVTAFADEGKEGHRKESRETPVKWDALPSAVQDAFKKNIGSGKIEKLEKEEKGGKTAYEAAVEVASGEYKMKVDADGKILEKELKEIKVKLEECPEAVQAALKAQAAGGEIAEIAMEEKHDRMFYEADVKVDGKTAEIKVSDDGKVLDKEAEGEEGEEKKD